VKREKNGNLFLRDQLRYPKATWKLQTRD